MQLSMEGEFSLFFPFNQNSFIFGHRSSLKILPGPSAWCKFNFNSWSSLLPLPVKMFCNICYQESTDNFSRSSQSAQCSALFSNLIEKITQVPLLTADKVALFTTQILYSDKKSSMETPRDPRKAGGLYIQICMILHQLCLHCTV